MADSDYRDDDRPRRRDDDDRPRKKGKGLIIVLVLLGVIGLVCVGSCVGFMWWGMSLAQGWQKTSEGVLAKVGSGDLPGAYNGMSASYKSSHTQEQFTKDMTDAKLTEYTGITWDNQVQSQNQIVTLTGTATLKGGGTTPVTVKLRILDMQTAEVEDIIAGGGGSTTPTTSK
jgi:hypothetical protein